MDLVAAHVGEHERAARPAVGQRDGADLLHAVFCAVEEGADGGGEGGAGGLTRRRQRVRGVHRGPHRADPRRHLRDIDRLLLVVDDGVAREVEGGTRAGAVGGAGGAEAGEGAHLARDHVHHAQRVVVRVAHVQLPRVHREREADREGKGGRLAAAVDKAGHPGGASEGGDPAVGEVDLTDRVVRRVRHEEQPRVTVDRQAARHREFGSRAKAVGVSLRASGKGGDVVLNVAGVKVDGELRPVGARLRHQAAHAHPPDPVVALVRDEELLVDVVDCDGERLVKGRVAAGAIDGAADVQAGRRQRLVPCAEVPLHDHAEMAAQEEPEERHRRHAQKLPADYNNREHLPPEMTSLCVKQREKTRGTRRERRTTPRAGRVVRSDVCRGWDYIYR